MTCIKANVVIPFQPNRPFSLPTAPVVFSLSDDYFPLSGSRPEVLDVLRNRRQTDRKVILASVRPNSRSRIGGPEHHQPAIFAGFCFAVLFAVLVAVRNEASLMPLPGGSTSATRTHRRPVTKQNAASAASTSSSAFLAAIRAIVASLLERSSWLPATASAKTFRVSLATVR